MGASASEGRRAFSGAGITRADLLRRAAIAAAAGLALGAACAARGGGCAGAAAGSHDTCQIGGHPDGVSTAEAR